MLEIIRCLSSADYPGVEVCLVTLTDNIEYEFVYDLPIRLDVIRRKHKGDLSVFTKLVEIIRTYNPDVYQSWGTLSSLYLSLIKIFIRRPLINAVLADAHPGLNWMDKHYRRVQLTAPFTDVFVSNSMAGIRAYHTPEHKSVCIYNGVDLRRFHTYPDYSLLTQFGIDKTTRNDFVVVMAASFDARKDHATVLKAALAVVARQPQVKFILLGSGPLLEVLKSQVPGPVLERNIFFPGAVTQVERYFQVADLGLLMTNSHIHAEGISNAIMESMLSGIPVVASKGGGTDEIILDGQNGFLVEPGKPEPLAERILFLEAHRDKCMEMGKFAREWSRTAFNIDSRIRQYVELYTELRCKKGKPQLSF